MRRRVSDHPGRELSLHDASRGALTCAGVWELTAYTNGCVTCTNHFSGELHRPIPRLGVSYGLSSLTELGTTPPDTHTLETHGTRSVPRAAPYQNLQERE